MLSANRVDLGIFLSFINCPIYSPPHLSHPIEVNAGPLEICECFLDKEVRNKFEKVGGGGDNGGRISIHLIIILYLARPYLASPGTFQVALFGKSCFF